MGEEENRKVSFYLPAPVADAVTELVEDGVFTTKTDLYQEAVRRLLLSYGALNREESGATVE